MTTIRKIVTSQVDGNSANESNTGEIRPFGEAGFYIDTNGNTNKLVLSMFEGQRTHLRSKVLSPGVFYGSNADSGDGAGFDTIKLIPDASLHFNDSSYGNDQYLVIDPTAPNHIHIRAGGAIDSSSADLFLGGEQNHVKVSDGGDTVTVRTSQTGEGVINRDWVFDNLGGLTFPNNSILDSADGNIEFRGMSNFNVEAGGVVNIVTDSTNTAYSWQFGDDGNLNAPGNILATGVVAGLVAGQTDTPLNIETYATDGESTVINSWLFGTDGNLTLPGGMKINSGDYGGSPRLVIDASTGGDGYLQLDASAAVLVGVNSVCNIMIGNISAPNTVTEILSPKVKFLEQTVPESSVGAPGDVPGLVAFDGSYIYYCTGTFGGTSYNVIHAISEGTSANGVDNGYLVADTYQLPQVGWKVYYDGEVRTINQVNADGIPGFYVVFVDSALVIPGQATFAWGPTPVTDIWKRIAWSGDTW